jgi:hypothetical protein
MARSGNPVTAKKFEVSNIRTSLLDANLSRWASSTE